MKQTELWIGGKFVGPSSGEYFDDVNPSDRNVLARVAKGTSADIGVAVRRLKMPIRNTKTLRQKKEKRFCPMLRLLLSEIEKNTLIC